MKNRVHPAGLLTCSLPIMSNSGSALMVYTTTSDQPAVVLITNKLISEFMILSKLYNLFDHRPPWSMHAHLDGS